MLSLISIFALCSRMNASAHANGRTISALCTLIARTIYVINVERDIETNTPNLMQKDGHLDIHSKFQINNVLQTVLDSKENKRMKCIG